MSEAERAANISDADEFEYIEWVDLSDRPLDLSSVRVAQIAVDDQSEGVEFAFAEGSLSLLGAGQWVVVVEKADAFSTSLREPTDCRSVERRVE